MVRGMAWSDQCRWVATPRWARASSPVTSTDQRMTTPCRSCLGLAARSVQKHASMRRVPSGPATSTSRRATGGHPGASHSAGREKRPQGFR